MNEQHRRRPLRALFLALALCAAAPCLAQTPAPSQAPTPEPTPGRDTSTGTIAGRVVGEGGEPLSGAAVYASRRAASAPAAGRRLTATTEDDGSFALTDIEPGVYSIMAALPGYVSEIDPLTGRTPGAYRPGDTATVRLLKGGVITGRVTDAQGEPVVALGVRAFRVRDPEGRPSTPLPGTSMEDKTDDRGVYRIYGLAPGAYVVTAGGRPTFFGPFPGAYDADAPTFYPSATRDTAAEVTVRTGQEANGIDIRFRDEPGRRVTGRVEGPAAAQGADGSIAVSLVYASTSLSGGSTFIPLNSERRSFSIEGVADGEYELFANVNSREGVLGAAPPQRVTVRGADVTGLKLVVSPLSSVSGKLFVEPAAEAEKALPECKTQPAVMPSQEVVVSARRERAAGERPDGLARPFSGADATPDRDGSFTLRSLGPGRYRLSALPLEEAFYVRAVQAPSSAPALPQPPATKRAGKAAAGSAQPATAAAPSDDVLNLASGQQFSGVTIRVAPGAASLSGVVEGRVGGPAPVWTLQSRVYLVPLERERADDPVRYAEAVPASDGSFAFKNLAPGRYRLLAREAGAETAGPLMRPSYRDADARAQLRRDAESSGAELELKPCQRLTDFTLRLQ
ncbi:MAG TPA: carboxypeptidase-like regulatory domain-containing protein [Pyrinomonadaceae bacterium]|nr:carboxypeptidase-like regulatory domain-containing protein [Pyrinomonadaceae bacterium]